jgi:pimeloyl-ACP methyl ester carboxylesterase
LILLHGFQSSAVSWLRVAEALQADYDCIMADFRGHGHSSSVTQGFDLPRMTDDIMDLVRELLLDEVAVIGHSMGAEVAGRLAAAYPKPVRAVVLIDPPMQAFTMPQTDEAAPWLQRWLETMQALKTQPHEERLLSAVQLMPPGVSLWEEADFVPLVEGMAQLNLDILTQFNTVNYAIAKPEIIDSIQCPILLLLGDPDKGGSATPYGTAAFTAKGKQCQIVRLDTGHFVHVDALNSVLEAVTEFFAAQY